MFHVLNEGKKRKKEKGSEGESRPVYSSFERDKKNLRKLRWFVRYVIRKNGHNDWINICGFKQANLYF